MPNRSVPEHVDSIGKLIRRLALVAKVHVVYEGVDMTNTYIEEGVTKRYFVTPPEKITISSAMLRKFSCTSGCTACCLPFTLDFLPEEVVHSGWNEEVGAEFVSRFKPREVDVNGRKATILSYEQYKDPSCPFLRPTRENGALGCGFYPRQPLECAAAPQLLMTTRGPGHTLISKRPFGRAWAWKDTPQCQFDDIPQHHNEIEDIDLSNEIGLLKRYNAWAMYFDLPTHLPEIIEAMENLPQKMRQARSTSYTVYDRGNYFPSARPSFIG